MKKINRKTRKVLAMVIVICLLATTVFVISNTGGLNNKAQAMTINENDKQMAGEISNLTGVPSDEILMLKSKGKTWNEILDTLKREIPEDKQKDMEKRSTLLSQNGLKEDDIAKLKSEGYNDTDITQAKMLVERVIFQLKEITSGEGETNPIPDTGTSKDTGLKSSSLKPDVQKMKDDNKEKAEDITQYSDLQGKIDINKAIYLVLKLKDEFGSMEKVLNEYLYTLQIGIDLELYLTDKKAYEKEKQEKSAGVDLQKIITLEKIESKMLEKIQSKNSKTVELDNMVGKTGDKNSNIPGIKEDNTLPKPALPEIDNMRPKDPRDDIIKEIDSIKNSSLN